MKGDVITSTMRFVVHDGLLKSLIAKHLREQGMPAPDPEKIKLSVTYTRDDRPLDIEATWPGAEYRPEDS